ncbi:MAG: aminotransferase [Euryarchaeota archaeon RBG_16_68_12]|nr:MAG: aminotransferase [Euryarchaeota archaeon RBG_16_68_12]
MFASRANLVELSGIRKMFERAPPDSINLGLGEPDFQPPPHILDALDRAVRSGQNKYGPTGGLPELRAAIAERLKRYTDVSPDQVLVTMGATEGLCTTMQTFVDRGDEVLTPDPGFVLFAPHVTLAGGVPVFYRVRSEDGFQPRVDELNDLVTPKTKAIVVNSPANPTGGVTDGKTIRGIAEIAQDHDLLVVSDEVYEPFVYEGHHESFLGRCEKLVWVNSFSKVFAITGWRIGYLVAPLEFVKTISKIHYYLVACPSTPVQHAALAGLKGPQDFVAQMVKEFSQRRDIVVAALNKVRGLHSPKPKGAFYAFPTFDHKVTSEAFALKLLEAGVICTPGSSFGAAGEGHLRFSYANSRENLERGMEIVAGVSEKLA